MSDHLKSQPGELKLKVTRDRNGKFAAVDPEASRRAKIRRKSLRLRRKTQKALWGSRILLCPGEAACPWRVPNSAGDVLECKCKPGVPCRVERGLYEDLNALVTPVYGELIGNLLTKSMVELSRAEHSGDPGVHNSRLKLLSLLLDDRGRAARLEFDQRRLDAAEGRKPKPAKDVIAAIVETAGLRGSKSKSDPPSSDPPEKNTGDTSQTFSDPTP
jgi:hypothetical protein